MILLLIISSHWHVLVIGIWLEVADTSTPATSTSKSSSSATSESPSAATSTLVKEGLYDNRVTLAYRFQPHVGSCWKNILYLKYFQSIEINVAYTCRPTSFSSNLKDYQPLLGCRQQKVHFRPCLLWKFVHIFELICQSKSC